MTIEPSSLRESVARCGERAGVSLTLVELEGLESYLRLLERWNRKINLTSLPLENFPSETLDRLIVEPLVASAQLPRSPIAWFDLGSGGGSPAIPMKTVRPHARLVMVESRSRKAAFLREGVRHLGLRDSEVLGQRIEEVILDPLRIGTADIVTVRAVKLERDVQDVIRALLKPDGRLLLFGTAGARTEVELLVQESEIKLPGLTSVLSVFRRQLHP